MFNAFPFGFFRLFAKKKPTDRVCRWAGTDIVSVFEKLHPYMIMMERKGRPVKLYINFNDLKIESGSSQGQYDLALEWYQKALVIKEKVLGKDHPATATTYNNIAVVYGNQGQYDLALEWYRKALTIFQRTLGPEHPYTVSTGKAVFDLEKLTKAE